ncbi:putative ribonuclease H-like domain-containing protein [Tanacetum coccineum]
MTYGHMMMRQYIAITDHILWDIITNGDQATTDPASSSAPKTSLAANARRNNEKALNILLSAIPDRHLLSFHDAVDARTLCYLSMLELYDAKVSQEDANLKFLRSLPSVWHVVATMIRGQPGLDELEFDDLYNKLMYFEHKSTADLANVQKGIDSGYLKQGFWGQSSSGYGKVTNSSGNSNSNESLYQTFQKTKGIPFGTSTNRKSFIPSAVLTRDGLISTARPKMTQTVPSKSTANVTYQGTARSRVPQAVLSRSTDGSYYPRMDNRRPRISSYSPSSRSSTTRTPHRPQRPKKIVKSIWVKKGSTVGSQAVLPQTVKKSAMISPKQTWKPKGKYLDSVNRGNGSYTLKQFEYGNPEEDLKDYAIIDSGCSGSMTGDKDKLSDFKEFKGGYVAFGNDSKGGRISGKGTIKTSCLDFEKVSYVEELKFNLLSVSQICDKKHNVLFTDKECLILSPKFKFVDEDLVILRAPRKNDVYSLDLKNIIPSGGITCLVAKATEDEAVLWHRRLGHVNFKNINKLVKGNLVRGLPSKTFKLDHSCVACRKGKQHRASCKKIEERTVREPLELLHMDLFGPVSVESVNRKKYCLVVTDDCSKFSWVFFLAYKDETYDMLHDLIVGLENRLRHKVKTIRCDHGTEFKNQLMNEFCAKKGIKREYSIARTPQQNGVAERKNRTLIEAARTMLADSLLPIQFWAEAVNTACYVLNRVLFDGKSEEGYLLGYSTNSKGFRVYNRITRKVQDCLHVNFLENRKEPKKVSQALADESWVEAMQEELLQFKLQEKQGEMKRGILSRNKARLVAQGYRQEEGVDYDEVFAPVARIEAIRLFLAFASFMGFIVYQMDVKSAFLYGNITEEVYVKQPPGFEDPAHPNKVYRVVKALYGLHQAPRAWYERLSTFLLKHGYRRGAIDKTLFIKKDRRDIMLVQVYVDDIIFGSTKSSMVKDFEDLMQKEFKMSSMGELTFFLGLQVKQSNGGIFLSQDKYVKDILNKFDFRTIKPASTPIEAHKSLGKDEEGEDVDVHLYRSMIGCLMYLTASRPDIMFAVCLCARFQVTPKVSHLHAVKRIFRYLKHQPNLGLWYPKDSPFHLEAFSDSDYAGDNHDRRSTSGGCQYLGRRLVSWQCKKQTIVAISSTEAEYVAAASCCAQVLWMQNQLLDYGFNFMNTEIHIDNESTICIVKNPVFHSKTKHIQIRHHFIRDCYEQRLINVVKVHTEYKEVRLITKGFDLARFNFLVTTLISLQMANIRTCNKHNMIACVEKTAQNADFYQIIDFLTGCSINYSLLVDPDLIGPWLQQFGLTASSQSDQ